MRSSPSILVTGASGFIGRALCARLKGQGAQVTGLMRRPAEGPWDSVVLKDLGRETLADLSLVGVDAVYHLASRVHALTELAEDADEYRRINVDGTRAVLDAAVAGGAGCFVYFSSVKAMGEGGDTCLGEDAATAPETTYGRSKREAEEQVLATGRESGLRTVVLRLPLVYGPGHRGNLGRMLQAVEKRVFPPLRRVNNRRSMVHVDDVVSAALLACQSPEAAGRTYLVTDGESYSTERIYAAMRIALGRGRPSWGIPVELLRLAARLGDGLGRMAGRRVGLDSAGLEKLTGSACYSSERIRRELGFVPRWNLESALPDMVRALDKQA